MIDRKKIDDIIAQVAEINDILGVDDEDVVIYHRLRRVVESLVPKIQEMVTTVNSVREVVRAAEDDNDLVCVAELLGIDD